MGRTVVTLVSKEQAEVGHRFRVVRIPDECSSCRLYQVCMGRLRPGRSYVITEVRPSLGQRCKITGGEMTPVVVEEVPLRLLLPRKKALEGVIVTYEGECRGCRDCPDESTLRPGEKILVEKVLGVAMCNGREFFVVEVSPV
ncbi:MAG: UPF0179 family protein [Thermoproteus sp.]